MSFARDVAALTGVTLLLAGCGSANSTTSSTVSAASVPLVRGARIVARSRQCDRGANAYCALEMVLVDRRVSSAGALVTRETELLRHARWSQASGEFGQEQGADSPAHKLHVTYATALSDLIGVDENWTKRSRAIALVLSREVLARVSAMSLMLETGPA